MKVFQKILLVFLSLSAGLIFCEFIVRNFFDFSQIVKVNFKGDLIESKEALFKLSNDPILLYEWKDLPQKPLKDKKENTFRIVVLGDSVTYRAMWAINDYYPKLLEDLLNDNLHNQWHEVINAGVPGYNTVQEVKYLNERWLFHSPDMVVVGYCSANDRVIERKIVKFEDGLYCSDTREECPYVLELPFNINSFLLTKSAFYRFINLTCVNMLSLSEKRFNLKSYKIKYFNLSLKTQKAIKKIKEISDESGFDLLFVIFPLLESYPDHESDWIVGRCKEYGIDYIDLRDSFKKIGYEKIRISDDDFCHPNKLGQKAAAEELFKYFIKRKLLKNKI